MITRTVLMTLVFAVVIGCGAAAFALMNGGGSSFSYASSLSHDDDREGHDDHDD